jgi:CheY-like chemotaxis protein
MAKGIKSILVVDDEEIVRGMLSDIFSDAGYKVEAAASAEEAMELMVQDPCRVVFSDLKLPGMNGTELCRKIREEWPMVIVFAVTGYASLFELSDCREAGFEDYFTKPVDRKLVLEAAAQAFKKMERWTKR